MAKAREISGLSDELSYAGANVSSISGVPSRSTITVSDSGVASKRASNTKRPGTGVQL